VEEGLDLAVRQERGLLGRRLREVAHGCRDGVLPAAAQLARGLQPKARGVAVLAFARVHVEVEVPHERARRRVVHAVRDDLRGVKGRCEQGI